MQVFANGPLHDLLLRHEEHNRHRDQASTTVTQHAEGRKPAATPTPTATATAATVADVQNRREKIRPRQYMRVWSVGHIVRVLFAAACLLFTFGLILFPTLGE